MALLVLNLSVGLLCYSSVVEKRTPATSEAGAGARHIPAELRADADSASVAGPQLSPGTMVPSPRSIDASDTGHHDGFVASQPVHVGGDLLQLQHVLRI